MDAKIWKSPDFVAKVNIIQHVHNEEERSGVTEAPGIARGMDSMLPWNKMNI